MHVQILKFQPRHSSVFQLPLKPTLVLPELKGWRQSQAHVRADTSAPQGKHSYSRRAFSLCLPSAFFLTNPMTYRLTILFSLVMWDWSSHRQFLLLAFADHCGCVDEQPNRDFQEEQCLEHMHCCGQDMDQVTEGFFALRHATLSLYIEIRVITLNKKLLSLQSLKYSRWGHNEKDLPYPTHKLQILKLCNL